MATEQRHEQEAEFQRVRDARRRAEKKRRAIAAATFTLVVAIAVCVFAGVTFQQQAQEEAAAEATALVETGSQDEAASEDGTSSEGWRTSGTTTVVDSTGREVKVPAYPQCIAIMDAFCGEWAVMIGADSRIYGLPGGVKSDIILQQIYPGLEGDTVVTQGSAVNIEDIVAAGCDVALVKSELGDDEVAKLERFDIPYVRVGYSTVDEQLAAMELVGQVCGGPCTAKADEVVAFYRGIVDNVVARAKNVPTSERVRVYHSINMATTTDSKDSLGADWIGLTGCVDVSAQEATVLTSGDYEATLDQVYLWDPDLIINNSYTGTDQILGDAQWASLRAVREGNVLTVPVGATRWGQRGSVETPLAMLWLGTTAYPELFADVDLKGKVCDYYHDYFGVVLNDAAYDAIIEGRKMRTVGNGNGSGGGGGNGGGNR